MENISEEYTWLETPISYTNIKQEVVFVNKYKHLIYNYNYKENVLKMVYII